MESGGTTIAVAHSDGFVERFLFGHKVAVIAVAAIITIVLGWQALSLNVQANFERMIPSDHPYIEKYFEHRDDLNIPANVLQIAVENRTGDIYDAEYIATLREINDALYYIPGVDRLFVESLWTPRVRWTAVTDDGFAGGPVISEEYDGSGESLEQLRRNVARSGEVGRLVSSNFRSSIIVLPLLNEYRDGSPIDYQALASDLESVREKFASEGIAIYVTGFAQLVGDLMAGVEVVMAFFGITVVIALLVLLWYTRCIKSAMLVVGTSSIGVIWLLGLLPVMGKDLDPYLVLVPFLVFAIGLSHGAQIVNGAMMEGAKGGGSESAARASFRRLFPVGLTALISDAAGFAALFIISIPIIRDLAVTASSGVLVLIFTNLMLLPVLMSLGRVARNGRHNHDAGASVCADVKPGSRDVWTILSNFTTKRWAIPTIGVALALAAGGAAVSQHLAIGDLDPGAPELRPDSRYNQDVAFIAQNYRASSDVLVALIETPEYGCVDVGVLMRVDALQQMLEELPGVENTRSYTDVVRGGVAAFNEGYFKWYGIPSNQDAVNEITSLASRDLFNQRCTLLTLSVYLTDHRAETLSSVTSLIERFAEGNNNGGMRVVLGAGNAGIEAATNIVVQRANMMMLVLVYGAVALLCFIAFRSVTAVLCALLPLMLTSVLCAALMVVMGIGVKVATLPVIALGVGIGVDYALYLLAATLRGLHVGMPLRDAYDDALHKNGRVVILAGVTLSLGVATWVLSPIKFQADMGALLSFMFLWNMLGALLLLPALARFMLYRGAAQHQETPR